MLICDSKEELAEYIKFGGFPAVHLQNNSQDEAYTVVTDVYNSNIYSDIVRRNQIHKIGDGEIDFIASKQNDRIYVQVTQEIRSEKTEKREYERLLQIKDNYPKYVLRTDVFASGNYQGIKTMHVADFLLSEDY